MKVKLYARINIKESDYISIGSMTLESNIQNEYDDMIDFYKQMNSEKAETLEGYKLTNLLLEVKIDRRKKTISHQDILKTLLDQGYTIKAGESLFGNYYMPTDKLISLLNEQKQKRHELINNGEYIILKAAI